MDQSAAVSGLVLEPLLQAAAGDAPVDELAQHCGVRGDLTARDELVPILDAARFWHVLEGRSQDPLVGLHAAERVGAHGLGLVECLARTSATLADAIDRGRRYTRLLGDRIAFHLARDGEVAALSVQTSVGLPLPRHAADFCVASMALGIRRLLGEDRRPREARLVHAEPATGAAEYARILGCPVRFGAAVDEIRFPAAWLASRPATADDRVCGYLDRHAGERLAALPADADFTAHLGRAYADAIERAEPTVERVGKTLAMSPRTLQRRLRAHGTSHRQLLDATRRQLAVTYLRDTDDTLETIATRLGFSESSAFTRAFRRWTGAAPGAYRAG